MIGIVGVGKVGSEIAFGLAQKGFDDLALIDIAPNLARGEAYDLSHVLSALGYDREIAASSNYTALQGCRIVVIAAGFHRRPGLSRLDLLPHNSSIVKSVSSAVKTFAPDATVIVVTNPVDVLTKVSLLETGFPRERVVGMGSIVDTARLRYHIANAAKAPMDAVSALVIGEHGDHMVPVLSKCKVGGKPLKEVLSPSEQAKIVQRTRAAGEELVALKGGSVHGPASGVLLIIEGLFGRINREVPVSVMLQGEYQEEDVAIGVPVRLGTSGVKDIIEERLEPQELEEFKESCHIVREASKEAERLS